MLHAFEWFLRQNILINGRKRAVFPPSRAKSHSRSAGCLFPARYEQLVLPRWLQRQLQQRTTHLATSSSVRSSQCVPCSPLKRHRTVAMRFMRGVIFSRGLYRSRSGPALYW